MVVLIISVLAMVSVPAIDRVKRRAKTAVIVGDFRTFAAAFDGYAQEAGTWPADSGAGVLPAVMAGRLNASTWRRTTPMGGKYNWESNRVHFGVRYRAAISIAATAAAPLVFDLTQLQDLERAIDPTFDWYGGSFHLGSGNIPLFIIQP